jgi:GGDEF domain-containing protein
MDALCLDVNHFHIVNERFGMAKGDEILRMIAGCLTTVFSSSDSVICRKTADTFLVYCTHRDDYTSITDKISEACCDMPTSIKLRIGVYASCDKKLDVRARFDRAKIASDLIRNNYSVFVSTFDETLIEHELFA